MSVGIWVGFLIGGILAALLFGSRKSGVFVQGHPVVTVSDPRECVWCDRRMAPPALNCSGLDEADLYGLPERHEDPLCRKTLTELGYTIEDGLARGVLRRERMKGLRTQ